MDSRVEFLSNNILKCIAILRSDQAANLAESNFPVDKAVLDGE
jgi:hypothetical protein